MFFRLGAVALALVSASALSAQQIPTGRVTGVVLNADNGQPVSDAGVQIVGTTLGTMTGADGTFRIGNVPAGTITIQVRRLGFKPITLTGLMLPANGARVDTVRLQQNVALVEAQIVSAAADKGSVEASLDEQRNASGVVSSVTSEQMGRSPDANAAQAVQRVSGVTVQDGKYVYVRGLGERYTTTSLNGTRLPSPEPERKVVPFDMFPSGLLQSVTTTKSFTPDLPGDFSGASVDIRTRSYPLERQLTYGLSLGYAEGALANNVLYAPGVGGEAFALAGQSRDLPASAARVNALTGADQAEKNAIINSFRNVWRSGTRQGHPNGSFRASLGGNDRMLGKRVGYLVSGTYSYSQDLRDDQVRALARPTSSGETEINRFSGTSSGESVLWGALLNAGSLISANSRVTLNALYNRTADNDARLEQGSFEDLGIPAEITRLSYVERSVWSTQLAGEHELGRRALDWSASGSRVSRNEPDRSELVYQIVPATGTTPEQRLWLNTAAEGAARTFSELDEMAGELKANYKLELGSFERPVTIKAGGLARGTHRDANTNAFGIFATVMTEAVRALPPEELFGGRFTAPDSSVLNIRSLAQGGSYSANDGLFAGYGMAEYALTPTLTLIGGARVERSDALVKAISTLGERSSARNVYTDVLPAVALNFRPSEVTTLRFSVSRTLARPEYRELAGIKSRDVLGGVDVRGNPDLVRTLIDNADIRWEFYPRRGELISAAVFAKRFHGPIERVFASTSTNSFVTFVNATRADNIGVELEVRKSLDEIAGFLEPFSAFSSVTVMRSQIHLEGSSGASTNASRAMVGQAPYVVNAGLTYATFTGDGSATLLFNRVGPRISEAGELPLPDVVEQSRNTLDFSLRFPARQGVVARLDAKNLLNAGHELRQGSVTREAYSIGRTLQLGVSVQR